jgi:flagellar biosynthetic protein FliR
LQLLVILAGSFTTFPLQIFTLDPNFFWEVCMFSAQMFVTGTLLALPVMIGVLLVNLGFGVMTRAAPQLNMFAMGFPITMLAGFSLILLSLPMLNQLISNSLCLL